MIIIKFICRDCGFEFESKVFEKGEAEYKRVPSYPVMCPRCKSLSVEVLK